MTRPLDRERIRASFYKAVNMEAGELAEWLRTPESLRVGQRKEDGESIGHASGRRIVEILNMPEAGLGESDYLHMRKVVGYIKRHRAQEPENMVTSRWRYSLMNWGHDPLK